MKRMMMAVCLAAVLVLTGSAAMAHNVWINVDNHFPAVGRTVEIGIAWGHKYPAGRLDQEMKPGNLAYIQVIDPDGVKIVPETVSETQYKLTVDKAGAYLVTAGIKPGVFTKTTEGRKWSDKRGVENAISCTSFSIEAKTVILAGGQNKNLDGKTGQALEVVPQTDPARIKAGDQLDLLVLFQGQPAAGVAVNAAYEGYTDENQAGDVAPHAGGHSKKFPAGGTTAADGRVKLTLDRAGYWIVTISHKTPYPDTTVCDEYMHNMAFTFFVNP